MIRQVPGAALAQTITRFQVPVAVTPIAIESTMASIAAYAPSRPVPKAPILTVRLVSVCLPVVEAAVEAAAILIRPQSSKSRIVWTTTGFTSFLMTAAKRGTMTIARRTLDAIISTDFQKNH